MALKSYLCPFEEFRLDRRGGGLFRRDDSGVFTPTIGSRGLDILGVLIARAGEVVSEDEIIAAVWPGTIVEDSNLTVQISALRRVLDRGRPQGSCIQTIPGRGYRFVGAVAQPTAEVQPPPSPQNDAPLAVASLATEAGAQRSFSRPLLGAALPIRRLAAILALDVAGYSRLMAIDEEGTHERLKAHHRQLVEPKIREHRGRIVKTTGDGMLIEFPSVVDAVRCAAAIQRGMIDREPQLPGQRRIKFRIGINLGDVIAEGGDIFGDGVNVAARLEALAEPGGICVSGVVDEQIRDKLPFLLDDLGEQSVKNIARPVRVYALRPEAIVELPTSSVPIVAPRRRHLVGVSIAAATAAMLAFAVSAWWLWPMAKSWWPAETAPATSISKPLVAPRLSIVVLPFTNLSNDPDQQYFADGITEDITTDLSRIANMFVISRNTAFTYRTKPADTKQIGRDLGVRYLLEGSVQRSGSQVRVSAQLIDAATDAHLWADRFDRDTRDLFSAQNEITHRLANTLGIELITAEAARPTDNPDALDYILRGRAAGLKPWTRSSYDEAVRMYELALELDPHSTEAQSLLAVVLTSRVLGGVANSPTTDIARAEALAGQALAASPRSALAHFAKGQVLRVQRRWEQAIPLYETAIALNRNFAAAFFALGLCKLLTGSIEETIPLEEQAIRLSPSDPQLGIWYQQIGRVHLLQSRMGDAILWFEKARSANPALPFMRAELASAYALNGDTERATAELAEARRLSVDDRYTSMARLRASGSWGVPKVRALWESTYFAGLRKAGMPEE
jgi:adenylate cyclase